MKYEEIKNMKVKDILGAKVKYHSPGGRRRVGVVYGVAFRSIVVHRGGVADVVPWGLVDGFVEVQK